MQLSAIKEKHPRFFVFDQPTFVGNLSSFRQAFEHQFSAVRCCYSVKTNYAPCVLSCLDTEKYTPEVVSEFELDLVSQVLGEVPVVLNGPIKTFKAIEYAVRTGSIVNVDSLDDWRTIKRVIGKIQPDRNDLLALVVRVNFGSRRDGHDIFKSRFGIDVYADDFKEIIDDIQLTPGCKFSGVHLHLPDRDLESFVARGSALQELSHCLAGLKSPIVNLGGGFFSSLPSAMRDRQVTYKDYAAALFEALGELSDAEIYLEPGTAVVSSAFSYFCRVEIVKYVGGRRIAVVNGSNFDYAAKSRSTSQDLTIHPQNRDRSTALEQETCVTGYTCIEGDILKHNVTDSLGVGDFIQLDSVGAYSLVMRPNFIFGAPPVFLFDGAEYSSARREQDASDLLSQWSG